MNNPSCDCCCHEPSRFLLRSQTSSGEMELCHWVDVKQISAFNWSPAKRLSTFRSRHVSQSGRPLRSRWVVVVVVVFGAKQTELNYVIMLDSQPVESANYSLTSRLERRPGLHFLWRCRVEGLATRRTWHWARKSPWCHRHGCCCRCCSLFGSKQLAWRWNWRHEKPTREGNLIL